MTYKRPFASLVSCARAKGKYEDVPENFSAPSCRGLVASAFNSNSEAALKGSCAAKVDPDRTLSAAETTALWAAVRQNGWPEGLELFISTLSEVPARALRLDLDHRHASWKGLLDPRHRQDVLVLDPGFGSIPISLSRDFFRVHALYTDASLMEIVRARAQWLGIENIAFVFTPDVLSFRFPEDSLDAVVIYGVAMAGLPKDFFQRCAVWLRSEGAIYVALRNRRRALNFLHDETCHGFLAARRRLRTCFPKVTCFRYNAELTESNEIIPLDGAHQSFTTKLISILSPLVAPSLALLASKTEKPHSLFREVTQAIETEYAREYGRAVSVIVLRQFLAFPAGCTLIIALQENGRRVVVRIPFDDRTLKRNRKNHDMLKLLHQLPISATGTIPEPILVGEVMRQPFFAESAVDGKAITPHRLRNFRERSKITAEAILWITQLHRATASPHLLDDSLVKRLIVAPLRRAFSQLSREPLECQFEAMKDFLEKSFTGRTINLVCSHGDYSVDNVLVDGASAKIKGVFDWDLSEERSLPLLDVFYFLLSAEQLCGDSTIGKILGSKLFPLRFTRSERGAVDKYCEVLQVPEDLRFPLALLTWIQHIAYRVENPELYHYHFPFWSAELSEAALAVALETILQGGVGGHSFSSREA